jgi:hypothetical protein
MKTYQEKDVHGMVPDPTLVGRNYRHVKTNGEYKVLGIMYNAEHDTWDYAYASVDGGQPMFTRSVLNFLQRFVKVESSQNPTVETSPS